MKKAGAQVPFLIVEYKKIERYLEKQASIGRKLERATYSSLQGFNFTFLKTDPQDIKYCIDLTEKADEEYLELCKDSGWEYVCSTSNMNFFRTTNKEAIVIQTDPEIEEQLIKKTMYHKEILKPILFCVIALLLAMLYYFPGENISDIAKMVGKGIGILYFSYGIFCLLIVGYLHHIIKERTWRNSKMIKPIIRYVYYPLPILLIGNFLSIVSSKGEVDYTLYILVVVAFIAYVVALIFSYIKNRKI